MKFFFLLTMVFGLTGFGLVLADGPDATQAPPPPEDQIAGLDPMFAPGGPKLQAMGGRRGGADRDPRHAGLGEGRHLEQFRTLKLLELLDLNEQQEDTFLKEFRNLRHDLGEIRNAKDSAITQLSSGLHDGTIADGRISELIDEIMAFQDKQRLRETAFYKEIKKFLSPQQLGRMVVFDQRFDRELLHKMEAFKDRSMRGPKMFDSLHGNDGN